jgi:hypothetical protein
MCADFAFRFVPAPDLTPEQVAELRKLADAATPEQDDGSYYEDERSGLAWFGGSFHGGSSRPTASLVRLAWAARRADW